MENSFANGAQLGGGKKLERGEAQEKLDNWAGRSTGMKCRTCIWFVPKAPVSLGEVAVGRCRRHAPTMSGWPVVYDTDWCGDHKIDEAKV